MQHARRLDEQQDDERPHFHPRVVVVLRDAEAQKRREDGDDHLVLEQQVDALVGRRGGAVKVEQYHEAAKEVGDEDDRRLGRQAEEDFEDVHPHVECDEAAPPRLAFAVRVEVLDGDALPIRGEHRVVRVELADLLADVLLELLLLARRA